MTKPTIPHGLIHCQCLAGVASSKNGYSPNQDAMVLLDWIMENTELKIEGALVLHPAIFSNHIDRRWEKWLFAQDDSRLYRMPPDLLERDVSSMLFFLREYLPPVPTEGDPE